MKMFQKYKEDINVDEEDMSIDVLSNVLSPTREKMIKVEHICKVYQSDKEKKVALSDVTLGFDKKGFVFINGISGSGKTTLMNIISGLDHSTSGKVYYDAQEMQIADENKWSWYRNTQIGIVFQNYNLIEDISVRDNLLIPLKIQKIPEEEYAKRIEDILVYVGLQGYEDRKVCDLSAGQRQRIAIARAIIKKPKVLLADEATGNLDQKNTENILNLFNKISKNCLVILISHDAVAAEKYGDRIITLSDGNVVGDSDNRDLKKLYEQPYEVAISNENQKIRGRFKDINIKKELEYFLHGREKVSVDLSVRKISPEDKEVEKVHWSGEGAPEKSLGIKNIGQKVSANIKKKKNKFVLMTLVIGFINTMLFSVNLVAGNNYDKSVVNYVEAGKYDAIRLKYAGNSYGEMQSGKTFYQLLQKQVGDAIVKEYAEETLEVPETEETKDVEVYVDTSKILLSSGLEGSVPENENEIVISRNLADTVAIGDEVSVEENTYTVVGISSAKFPENDAYVILTSDMKIKEEQCYNLQGADISVAADKSSFAYEIETFGSVKYLEKENYKLLSGRMPMASNEVLISSEMAEKIKDEYDGYLPEEIRIPNMHGNKVVGEYAKIPNLSEYMGQNISIVGIYDETTLEDDYGNVIVTDEIFQNVMLDYFHYASCDSFLTSMGTDPKNTISHLEKSGIFADDMVCEQLYGYGEVTKNLRALWFGIYIVLLALISVTLITYLTNNVKGERKTIGIYTAIGICNRDISNIYLLENTIINGSAVVLAVLLSCGVRALINRKICSIAKVKGFQCFSINWGSWILIAILLLLIGYMITYIPMKRLLKKESITLLNQPGE